MADAGIPESEGATVADEHLSWSVCRGADGSTVVVLMGELDSPYVAAVTELLKSALAQGSPVTVDLGLLTFLDSAGLRSLLRAAQDAAALGSRMIVTNATGMVRRVIAIAASERELLGEPGTEEVGRPVAS
jgi:anti-anti-sigma factor